jgi:hypothetical protein
MQNKHSKRQNDMKTFPSFPLFPSVKAPVRLVSRCNLVTLVTLVTVLAATGCTVLTYKSETGEHFVRSSLGSKTSIAHLSVESRTNGVHKVDLRGYKDDNTEALGAITDAAIKAAISAAKP